MSSHMHRGLALAERTSRLFPKHARSARTACASAAPMASQIPAAALARYRSPAVLGLAARLWPVRALSSYNVEQSAMQALLTTPSESSNLPTDTLVFVLCTAEQGGKECLVLLSTRCPDTKLYTITLPWAQMREREDTGLAGARALIDAGIKSSSVVRNGPGTAIHPGALQAQVIVETMTIQTLDGINAAANDNVAVVLAPVKNLRSSLMTLSNEGRVIDENLFFFAAGMEAMTGGMRHSPRLSGTAPAVASAGVDLGAAAKERLRGDFVSRFGHIVGAMWLCGAVLYAGFCMQFAY